MSMASRSAEGSTGCVNTRSAISDVAWSSSASGSRVSTSGRKGSISVNASRVLDLTETVQVIDHDFGWTEQILAPKPCALPDFEDRVVGMHRFRASAHGIVIL